MLSDVLLAMKSNGRRSDVAMDYQCIPHLRLEAQMVLVFKKLDLGYFKTVVDTSHHVIFRWMLAIISGLSIVKCHFASSWVDLQRVLPVVM